MESVLARLQVRERNRVRVGRVDADDRPDLVRGLGVQEIPSIVMFQGASGLRACAAVATLGDVERTLRSRPTAPAEVWPGAGCGMPPLVSPSANAVSIRLPVDGFVNVARLVTAGVGSQLAFGFEAIDDLQLAIELALRSVPAATGTRR